MMYRPRFTWDLGRGRALALGERTVVMGIVNVTPDSFSDGGQFLDAKRAVEHALQLLDDGADIVDIGAESTRPGALLDLSADEEQQRLAPVIAGVLRERPEALISIDTFNAPTARAAVSLGAAMVNDVSGLQWDAEMAATCAELECGLVMMHTRGRPTEWASLPPLDNVLQTVTNGLRDVLHHAKDIALDRIVLDPGFGFGKRGGENIVLLNQIDQLHALNRPLLIGLSRKGFLAPGIAAQERDAATVAANTVAILQGAHIVRVHDVRGTVQAVRLADELRLQARVP